jgi:protein SPA2
VYASPGGINRRKPSADIMRKSEERDRDLPRRPSQGAASDATVNAPTSTVSGMIVPNKSTITEEDIEVPYGRDALMDDRDRDDRSVNLDSGRLTDRDPDSASDYASVRSPPFGGGGLSGLSERLLGVVEVEDEEEVRGVNGGRDGDGYYERGYERTQPASSGIGGGSGGMARGRDASNAAEQERMRSDYEYKISKMQTQISTLQRDLEDAEEQKLKRVDAEERVRQMEEELKGLRRVRRITARFLNCLELTNIFCSAQRNRERPCKESWTTCVNCVSGTKTWRTDAHGRTRKRSGRCVIGVIDWKASALDYKQGCVIPSLTTCLPLSYSKFVHYLIVQDPEIVEQLRSDMQGLLVELSDLSRRNDEALAARDSDQMVIRDLDGQLKDYKRKYELAKTDLRNVKGTFLRLIFTIIRLFIFCTSPTATSQLFLQPPKVDDQLPLSQDGGLPDIHITAFLSSIDGLLTAGRANSPTKVLTPMKSVVNAVSAIIDDVRAYERRLPRDRSGGDLDLETMRERAEATLSNLVAATKTHATSAGMSPVSLLDAAASHVSAAVTEIGKTLCIRKATKAEQEQFTAPSAGGATNGFSPSLRTVDELSRAMHGRKGSAGSSRRSDGFSPIMSGAPPSSSNRAYVDSRRRAPSEPSSSEASSPPPIFDQPPLSAGGVGSDDSATADGPEDAWAELKVSSR